MRQLIIIISVITFLFSCKNDQKQEGNNEEVAFNIDSTLFNFERTDTFLNVKLPHLINWKVKKQINDNEKGKIILTHPDSLLFVEIENFEARKPNSYNYYNNLFKKGDLAAQMLDISTYIKSDKKLIQIILKDLNNINFKLIEDLNGVSKEVNIFIPNLNYVDVNIRIVESIIGVLDFI